MKTILIVDDQERIRRIYRRLFLREGYQVFDAGSADDANEILKKEDVDLVLLDIRMPEVEGSDLSEVTRMFHKNTKVIVSSVYPLEYQRQRIRGAVDYYDKSESLKVLKEKVRKNISRDLQGKRILIIEDDRNMRFLYHQVLSRSGYHPYEVSDTKETLKIFKKNIRDFDLVVLDIAMPNIDGMHFFEMIKMKAPDIKVMVSSVYSVDEQQFFIFGADAYFDKSEGNTAFLQKVKKLIEN